MLLLDSQVHHDTHVIPMGNYVIGVGNYVIVSPSELGNYVSADTWTSLRLKIPRTWLRRWAWLGAATGLPAVTFFSPCAWPRSGRSSVR